MILTWPLYFCLAVSLVAVPLYIAVLFSLQKLRRQSFIYRATFYTLLFQHGIADLFTMTTYLTQNVLTKIPAIFQLFYTYQDYYLAAGTYNSVYYTLYIRCCGIVLLTLQRFITVHFGQSKLNQIVQRLSSWKIISIYWILPTLLSIVPLKDHDMHIEPDGQLILDKSIISRNTTMAFTIVLVACSVCVITYTALFLFVRNHSLTSALRREMHLSIQLVGLVLAFFLMLAYYSLQTYFSLSQNSGPVFTMRSSIRYPTAFYLM
ncbi:unnamed protein product [Caenorhabditis auriculariae]|uniref:G-protein coupled receptors family 1 profile domain-containing protein n=1 Tax=Caenorhabditis auriculariae TaxID=2777116 RepID=A0A8S1HG28_9PELO|nr:unnamed protein product [Caenorhabditis auriculariae]